MRSASVLRDLLRNMGFLFFAFAGSAHVNVVPQIVFARTAPAAKSLWLSATLLIGTIACMGAVDLARRLGYGARPRLGGGIVVAATLGTLFLSAGSRHALSFAIYCVVLRALCQYASQENDRRAAVLAGAAGRAQNDAISLSLRFAGMLAGPLFVGLHPDFDGLSAGLYLGLAALALCGTVAVAPASPIVGSREREPHAAALSLRRSERLVIWAGRLSFACYTTLAACVVYAMRDIHGLTDAARRGSMLITAAFGSAMVATPVLAALRGRGTQRALFGMLPAPIGIVAAGLLISTPAAARLGPALVGAVGLGVAFAAFQLSFRDYASQKAVEGSRTELLAIFNNLANTSAFVAFAAMLGLSLVARALAVEPARAFVLGVAALGLVAIAVTIWARRAHLRSTGS